MIHARHGLSPKMLNLTRLGEHSPPPGREAAWNEFVETMRAALERYMLAPSDTPHGRSQWEGKRP